MLSIPYVLSVFGCELFLNFTEPPPRKLTRGHVSQGYREFFFFWWCLLSLLGRIWNLAVGGRRLTPNPVSLHSWLLRFEPTNREVLTDTLTDSISDVGAIVAGRWGRELCKSSLLRRWFRERRAGFPNALLNAGGWIYFIYQVAVTGSAFIGLSTALNAVSCKLE